MKRLGQHIKLMAIVECFVDQVPGRALAGEKDHFAFRMHLAYMDRELNASHAGHDHVREEEIGGDHLSGFQSVQGMIEKGGFEALSLDDRRQSRGDDWFVIDYVNQLPVCAFAHGLQLPFVQRFAVT